MSEVTAPLGEMVATQMENIESAIAGQDGWEIAEAVSIVLLRNVDGREGKIRLNTLTGSRAPAIGLVQMARHELLGQVENR